jgi:FAD synthetase
MASKKGAKKRKIVLASGVFDLLHLGHVRFLEEAKKAGGRNAELVVIIARDSTVVKRKGVKPVMTEDQRCALVASLRVVDCAMLGYEDFDVKEIIDKIKPDVIVFGYDQNGMRDTIRKYMKEKELKLKIVRVGKFGEEILASSSKIKQKIVEDFKR